MGFHDDASGLDIDAAPAQGRRQRRVRVVSQLDHRGHLDPGRVQIYRDPQSVVVGRYHHRPPARHGCVQVQQSPGRRPEHDAGQIVVLEHERPFEGAVREYQRLGSDLEQPGVAFCRADPQVLVDAKRVGFQLDGDVGIGEHAIAQPRGQFVCGKPFTGCCLDSLPLVPEMASEVGAFFEQGHPHPAAGCAQGGTHARGPAADHEKLGETVFLIVVGRGSLEGHVSQPRRVSQYAFVPRPQELRAHERAVVETRRHEARAEGRKRHEVGIERRPHVLGGDVQSGCNRLDARTDVGLVVGAHHAVRVCRCHGERRAGPVVLEGTAEHPHTGRPQRTGHRVALEPFVRAAVE